MADRTINRITLHDIQKRKGKESVPLVCLTAYTAPFARILDNHTDILLVGDSVAMVLYGMEDTLGADLGMMIRHGRAVVHSTEKAFIVVDMPYGSYEESPAQALESAQRIIDETKCQALKLEGGENMKDTISYLVQKKIPVMGHIGLQPQSVHEYGSYKARGQNEDEADQILRDAKAVEEAGAFSVVIEAVPEPLAARITESVLIPTIGIGASPKCDGQILVTEDMLGLGGDFKPKFVKRFADLNQNVAQATRDYARYVKTRAFPASENLYFSKGNEAKKIYS